MCIVVTFISITMATAVALFEKILQNAVDMISDCKALDCQPGDILEYVHDEQK
ncbi:MAG: helix-turn-helix domain-containing protein [Bacteroidia bacterium]|nr:helix-turn-helix domain-containing protein [Bacteroidia bacterium]